MFLYLTVKFAEKESNNFKRSAYVSLTCGRRIETKERGEDEAILGHEGTN